MTDQHTGHVTDAVPTTMGDRCGQTDVIEGTEPPGRWHHWCAVHRCRGQHVCSCGHQWPTPIAVQVVETPAERLRRLALVEDVPRKDLWHAIATAVIDVNERLAVLEAQAADRATWTTR